MRPYLSLITILPTQGRSSRGAVHVESSLSVCRGAGRVGLTNCASTGQPGALKRAWARLGWWGGPSQRNHNEDITAQGAKPIHDMYLLCEKQVYLMSHIQYLNSGQIWYVVTRNVSLLCCSEWEQDYKSRVVRFETEKDDTAWMSQMSGCLSRKAGWSIVPRTPDTRVTMFKLQSALSLTILRWSNK